MKKVCVFVLSIFVFCSILTAQESNNHTVSLTIDEAVVLALDNNISIKQSKMSLDLLESKKKTSWNSISPSLALSGTMSDSGDIANDPVFDGVDKSDFSAGASVRLSFSPALFTSIKAAKLAYEAGEATLEATQRSIELSVRKDFYRLLYTKENIDLQVSILENAKQTYESNVSKYNAGRLAELDLLNSEYSYESKIPAIESLKNTYQNSIDTFKQVLGIPLNYDIQLVGDLESAVSVNLDEAIINADLESLPAVEKVQRNIDAQKNNLTATRVTAWSPSMSFSTSATLSEKKTATSVNPVTGEKIITESGPWRFNYSVGVSIPLDGFLPWSSGAMSIKTQKTTLESLYLDLENTKTTAAISIRNSYNSIVQAQSQLAIYEKNAELSERTYKMTQTAYNAGATPLSNLQTAESNLASTKYNLQTQRYTIISAVLDLENTIGLPFGTLSTSQE